MKKYAKYLLVTFLLTACMPSYAQTVIDTKSGASTSTPAPDPDVIMTKSIQGKFLEDKTLAGLNILVKVVGGNVTLEGTVDNQVQEDTAVRLAKTVVGVTQVESQITVKGEK